ncbi:nucleotidyltransferase domain-containing protein [Haladaptatus salinisoli]|uniref:nucleotidyltransferase domain-containing protein n=1 Tax=Haladaptatus salinisoli TaxID=2884876 RepID=UPI001D0A5A12|nr:nucleotidyltransferase [Haladaptatus salinisoli]
MPIPPKTLESWKGYSQAAIKTAKKTHTRIQEDIGDSNLEESSPPNSLSTLNVDTHLQGSYANYTIVPGTSDVDVLVLLTNYFESDRSELDSGEETQWQYDHYQVPYSAPDFRQNVLNVLRDLYGTSAVSDGGKAIEINSDSDQCPLQLDADVVPCLLYKYYTGYSEQPGESIDGIYFEASGNSIINYPFHHKEKRKEMNKDANGNYMETIRMFKRARNYLIEKNELSKDSVPSYYIECLLSNVDPECFHSSDLQERYTAVLLDIVNLVNDGEKFTVQHGMKPLFSSDGSEWNPKDAAEFIVSATDLYENWDNY